MRNGRHLLPLKSFLILSPFNIRIINIPVFLHKQWHIIYQKEQVRLVTYVYFCLDIDIILKKKYLFIQLSLNFCFFLTDLTIYL